MTICQTDGLPDAATSRSRQAVTTYATSASADLRRRAGRQAPGPWSRRRESAAFPGCPHLDASGASDLADGFGVDVRAGANPDRKQALLVMADGMVDLVIVESAVADADAVAV
jgi:hypothetical protein